MRMRLQRSSSLPIQLAIESARLLLIFLLAAPPRSSMLWLAQRCSSQSSSAGAKATARYGHGLLSRTWAARSFGGTAAKARHLARSPLLCSAAAEQAKASNVRASIAQPAVQICSAPQQARPLSSSTDSVASEVNATSPTKRKPHYTTTPIFYVNAAPHVGHLHSIVLADVYSRWAQWRHRGWSSETSREDGDGVHATAVLATGTDEHGIKIQKASEASNESPRALCDRVSERFRELTDKAGTNATRFIRTTDEDHKRAVRHLWNALTERGFIYKGKHEGWYSTSDEAFYTGTQIKPSDEDPSKMVSIETGSVVEWSSEDNFKFRLSAFQEPLLARLKQEPDAVVPPSRRDALVAEIREGLADLSVSRPRSRLQWGIPVPNDETHTIYVWLDALTNYLTVAGYPWPEGSADMGCWPADVQVIGKDILRFHAVYFPAFLMALNIPLPKHLVTHGHWTMNKAKMSKSRGNVADPFAAIDTFGCDALRWLLCRVGGNVASNADWSDTIMHEYHRKYLQGQLGNLASRVMGPKMLRRLLASAQEAAEHADVTEAATEFDPSGVVILKRPSLDRGSQDEALETSLASFASSYSAHMERFEVHRALDVVEDVLANCNRLVQQYEPWRDQQSLETADAESETTLKRYQSIWQPIYLAMETCRLCALLLHPIMPTKMDELLHTLYGEGGKQLEFNKWENACVLRKTVALPTEPGKVPALFPRLQ